MNLSHAYSDRARHPKSYPGIGLVVALHLAGIYALSAGIINTSPRLREVTPVKALPPEVNEPPPPVEHPKAPAPKLNNPQPSPVPEPEPIDVFIKQEPIISTVPMNPDAGPLVAAGPTATTTAAPPQSVPKTRVQTPGAVCSVMPKPDLPALNWSGEAVLQVTATVRGGRVVGSEFRVAQGALDSKTKRSLQHAVESALAGYQCQGDAVFQQDFAFRLD